MAAADGKFPPMACRRGVSTSAEQVAAKTSEEGKGRDANRTTASRTNEKALPSILLRFDSLK